MRRLLTIAGLALTALAPSVSRADTIVQRERLASAEFISKVAHCDAQVDVSYDQVVLTINGVKQAPQFDFIVNLTRSNCTGTADNHEYQTLAGDPSTHVVAYIDPKLGSAAILATGKLFDSGDLLDPGIPFSIALGWAGVGKTTHDCETDGVSETVVIDERAAKAAGALLFQKNNYTPGVAANDSTFIEKATITTIDSGGSVPACPSP